MNEKHFMIRENSKTACLGAIVLPLFHQQGETVFSGLLASFFIYGINYFQIRDTMNLFSTSFTYYYQFIEKHMNGAYSGDGN